MKVTKGTKKLASILSALPGIGPRQALRLTFYLIRQGQGVQQELGDTIKDLKGVKICGQCFYVHENPGKLCDICSDAGRDHSTVAIVEKETDLISIESTGKYKGRYLVIGELGRGGILGPDQKLKLKSLRTWIAKTDRGMLKEVIIALNPNVQNDFVASQISGELKSLAGKITRLGVGIPSGGEIEFADDETLGEALKGRG